MTSHHFLGEHRNRVVPNIRTSSTEFYERAWIINIMHPRKKTLASSLDSGPIPAMLSYSILLYAMLCYSILFAVSDENARRNKGGKSQYCTVLFSRFAHFFACQKISCRIPSHLFVCLFRCNIYFIDSTQTFQGGRI